MPVNVTVELGETVVNGLVPNTTVVPTGLPEADNVIGLTNPLLNVALTDPCIEGPAGQEDGAGEMPVRVKSGAAAVIVKFALLISKKILPTASTFILAVVVAPVGIVTAWEPSFGVLANITVG